MKTVDLTHSMKEGMPVYPGTPEPSFITDYTIEKDGFAETHLNMYSHTGTHMDFPAHMIENALTSSDFETDKFYGNGLVIDCRNYSENSVVDIEYIRKYDKQIEVSDFVLFNFGWDSYWGEEKYFSGYPVLSQEATQYLVEKNIKAVGFDAISIDISDSLEFKNHMIALGANMLIIENLTNLSQLIDKNFKFAAFPLKLSGKDGSPVRAVAIIE